MTPAEIGQSYDELAERWSSDEFPKSNGIAQHRRAIALLDARDGYALDVGCGSSGRIVELLRSCHFAVEGVDISRRMIELARLRHPDVAFFRADICEWKLPRQYDFISAWDSLWHVPLSEHERVLGKLLRGLATKGVCIFTMGGLDAPGEKVDSFMGPRMYYSSIGIARTLAVLDAVGCICRHLEYDQYPELHVYVIAQKC